MEYTINKLSQIAGITTRALRYYDNIGLLKPLRINSSGYRIYGENEAKKLQLILFYRVLGVKLENIKSILDAPSYDAKKTLMEHRDKLTEKRNQLDLLISNVEKSIAEADGSIIMQIDERFEGFKRKSLKENEMKYGHEIREKYGDDQIDKSNKRYMSMTKEQYAEVEKLGGEVIETLKAAYQTGDPTGETAQKAADLHRQWLSYFWENYTKESHAGVAQMYVEDARFKAYYDKHQPGLAEFLRDAVFVYTEKNK